MVDDDRLQRLSSAQRKLYEQRLREKHGHSQVRDAIPVTCRGPGPHALSFAQERFWFLDQLEPDSAEYNISGAARLRGALDRAALGQALADLLARHAALRTTFPSAGGVPGQCIGAVGALELPVDDLRGTRPTERDAEVDRRARAFARAPFDLARGPLFRMCLLVLDEHEHVVLFSKHHSISDGWSLALLVGELPVLYAARLVGRPPDLPQPPITYADYAAWQRDRMRGAKMEQLVAHWRTALAGAPSSLELPFDRPRRSLATHAGRTLRWEISPELTAAIRALSAREHVTPFVLLLAAFQAFLSRLTGAEDVVIGSSVANRDRRELEGVVGAFVNTIVLRTSCAADPTFRELVARARDTARAAFAHAELPFEKLVAELVPARDPSRTPFFNVFFDMVVPRPRPKWPGLEFSELPFENGNSLFDLSLSIEDRGGELSAAFEYATDVFDPATVERLQRLLTHFLASAIAAPDLHVSRLSLLDAKERALVIDAFNATTLAYDRAQSAHVLFALRAKTDPAAIAIEDGAVRVTYAELDRRANRLAHALMRLGTGPEARVAVCLPRSIDAIVALYAVWKSGAAYVPLDVDDPAPRWIDRLADVGATALIAHASVTRRVAGEPGWTGLLVALDADAAQIALDSAEIPRVTSQPQDLAYVLFTSGSTGTPKGVMIEHGALANHLAWVRAAFDLRADDRFLLRTPFTFDASLWEIVHPLAVGATLVVAPHESGRDPSQLLDLCARSRITILQTVPSLLRIWLDEPTFARVRALRHLICAGEALDPDLSRRFDATTRALGLRIALHNLYGPSEACIDATWHTLAPIGDERGLDAIPIGRPISNAQAFVLDARREPVPVGIVGELWLGGDGLGRGYWNDPTLTAERFVEHAFDSRRLYRTGDLVRRLADGDLVYVGRADRQLKLHGVRVEPGEIEAELRAHAGVRDAAVVAVPTAVDGLRLHAFAVPTEGSALDVLELRTFLARRLPRALVPGFVTVLEALPVTTSLKVDLLALKRMAENATASVFHEPPTTATERRLAVMTAELLRVGRVGRADDFFALGGHSLLAAQLVARVREEWRIDLLLARFFEGPSVGALAQVIDEAIGAGTTGIPVRIPRLGRTVSELSFAQEGLWIAQQLDPESALYDVSGGLRLLGVLVVDALDRALQRVVLRHDILRSTFEESDGVPRMRVHTHPPEMQRLDLSVDPRGSVAALRAFLESESRHVFDLRSGPLLRVTLLRLGVNDHVLATCVHHIVADGWSLELLAAELAQGYARELAGDESALDPLAIQYADWAAHQRAMATAERYSAQLAYWRASLAGAPPRTRLPIDRPEPDDVSHAGATSEFELDSALIEALRTFSRERRTPLYPVLAGAFVTLLHRMGADDDIVLGTVAGIRPHAVLETLIGPFVNVLPLRIDLGEHPGFAEVVRRVADATNAALQNADVPFDHIVRAAAPVHAPGREPFVNVACDLQSFPESRTRFPGLEAQLVHVDPGTTKLDLSLTFEDDGLAIRCFAQYSTDLFDAATIAGLTRCYRALLTAALVSPDAPTETLAFGAEAAAVVADSSSGVRSIVLDQSGTPLPHGIVGELCSDASDSDSRERTGNLARITSAGRVVLHGRVDEAVRIGGRRVRPSVIEGLLTEGCDVTAAVVESRTASDGESILVAHVFTGRTSTLDLVEVREGLRRRLPAAWIPRLWRIEHAREAPVDRAVLARVPLTAFAAIDRAEAVAPRGELEARVHTHFTAVLQRDDFGVLEDFFALGGNSLAAMRLVARLRAAFDVDLALGAFYASASVAGAARGIEAARSGAPRAAVTIDFDQESRLGPDFPTRIEAHWSGPPRRWFLTGATGYLGAFLLRGLLDRGAERVACLVRSRDEADGLQRIVANLQRYELAADDLDRRVRIVCGDLGARHLGLTAASRDQLANEVDGIVHSGASVNFLADYARLRATNVEGTRTLLEIAAHRGLPFHHVSTIGVFPRTDDRARIQREDDPLPDPIGLEWGYEQTKWVAETLVARAGARGLDVAIHRPGRISGSSRGGAWNLDDFAARTMRGCVEIGAAPDLDVEVDATPVDWVASAITHLAARRPRGAAYHLSNPRPTSFLGLFERLRARGADVQIVPFPAWLASVRAAVADRPDHVLAPLLEMLGAERADVEPARFVPDIDLPQLDQANVLREVIGEGIACPEIDDALRDRWIDHFVRVGAITLESRANAQKT